MEIFGREQVNTLPKIIFTLLTFALTLLIPALATCVEIAGVRQIDFPAQ
jgi:hypothetical protein